MNALEQARELAEPLPDRKALSEHIAAVGREIDALEGKKHGLLPIEADAQQAVSSTIAALKEQRQGLRRDLRKVRKPCPHKKLSLEPLGWRDKNGYPKLVLFPLDRPTFTLERGQTEDLPPVAAGVIFFLSLCTFVGCFAAARGGWEIPSAPLWPGIVTLAASIGMVTSLVVALVSGTFAILGAILSMQWLPKRLQACYADVIPRLQREDRSVVRITTRFTGAIPPATREKIRKARKEFKKVLILAESDPANWKVVKADPLVVGWDGESLWLVDSFDTTPTEEYVKREFAI